MAKQRHTGTFIVGAIVGGLAAAGYTLWKTPKSGANLRAALAVQAEGLLDRVTALGERIGIETGPEHDYSPHSAATASSTSQPAATTVKPGEGPIADDDILPVIDGRENVAPPSAST
ncbi:MAG: hypothetical protein ACJ789_19935 [Thermomicrobiales bacterium]